MSGGGLFDPLGAGPPTAARSGTDLPAPIIVAGIVLLGVAALVAVAWFRDDGGRGVPRAVAPIERVAIPPKPPASLPAATPPVATPPAAPPGLPVARDDQEVEIQNGVRIIRPRRDRPASSGETLRVPDVPAAMR